MASSPKPPVSGSALSSGGQSRGEDLRAWLLQYGPALRRYFMRRAGAVEADDLVQDVFVNLQARSAGAEIENVERYLFRTAASVLATRRREATWNWGAQDPIDDIEDAADELSPERILIGKQAIITLANALDDLPPRSAQAFFLCRFEHLSQEAAARRMGISVKAVEELMRRAFKLLGEQVRPRL